MPIVSDSQWGAMQAAANGDANSGALGIPPQVAQKFIAETPGVRRRSFAKQLAKKKQKQNARQN